MLPGVKSKKPDAHPAFGLLPSKALAGKKPVGKKPPPEDDDEVKQMRHLGRRLRAVAKVLEETKKDGMRDRQYHALERLLKLVKGWQKA